MDIVLLQLGSMLFKTNDCYLSPPYWGALKIEMKPFKENASLQLKLHVYFERKQAYGCHAISFVFGDQFLLIFLQQFIPNRKNRYL